MNLFKDLQREYEVSYLLVAHDLGTTRYMADDIAVMYLADRRIRGQRGSVRESRTPLYASTSLGGTALPPR